MRGVGLRVILVVAVTPFATFHAVGMHLRTHVDIVVSTVTEKAWERSKDFSVGQSEGSLTVVEEYRTVFFRVSVFECAVVAAGLRENGAVDPVVAHLVSLCI